MKVVTRHRRRGAAALNGDSNDRRDSSLLAWRRRCRCAACRFTRHDGAFTAVVSLQQTLDGDTVPLRPDSVHAVTNRTCVVRYFISSSTVGANQLL